MPLFGWPRAPIFAAQLGAIIDMEEDGTLSRPLARKVLDICISENKRIIAEWLNG